MKYFLILITFLMAGLNNSYCVDSYWEKMPQERDTVPDPTLNYAHYYSFYFSEIMGATECYFTINDSTYRKWKKINIDNPKNLYLFDGCIREDKRLLVVADSGYIIEKNMNDSNCVAKKIITPSEAITKIAFKDNNFGIVINNGKELFSTSDGGKNWNKMSKQIDDFPNGFLIQNIFFLGDTIFLIIYDFSSKFQFTKVSFDSGESWQPAYKFDEMRSTPSTYYYNNGKIWFSGKKKTGVGDRMFNIIQFSDDFGKTWKKQLYSNEETNGVGGISTILFFDNEQEGLAFGSQVFYTSNGGNYWEALTDTISNANYLNRIDGPAYKINDTVYWSGIKDIYKFVKGTKSIIAEQESREVQVTINNNELEITMNDNKICDEINLYDISGRLLLHKSNIMSSNYSINLNDLNSSGIILALIKSGSNTYFKKIAITW